MNVDQQQLAVRIGRAWRDLRRGASTAALRDYLLGSGDDSIELGQMDTLDLLATGSSWRMSEIAEATNATLSRLSHVCSRLERRGLVQKSTSPADRRVSRVTLTNAGRRELVRATPGHIATARRLVIDALSPEDLADLARITAKLGEQLDPEQRFATGR